MTARLPIKMLVLAAAILSGCDQGDKKTANPTTVPAGNGLVFGRVICEGTPPPMPVIPNQPCCPGAEPYKDEGIVAYYGSIQNVIVYLEGVPKSDGGWRTAAVLDQVHCRYVPHVLAVQVNQPVRVRSSDPIPHNVHYNPEANPAANLSMTQAGQEQTVSFANPEIFMVRCDVHPWMNAWIGVFDHPYFAVTDQYGRFRIEGIPAGKYKLATWQERLGKQEKEITVEDGKPLELEISYKMPGQPVN